MVETVGIDRRLKWISLLVLIAQTTALVIILRYSRIQKTEGPRYLSSAAVVMAEIVKVFSCLIFLLAQNMWDFKLFCSELYKEAVLNFRETIKLGVPALLYVVQNNLLFLALSKLDAATYQVTYQLKILTTAFFSVTMLGRRLNWFKWVSLVLLTIGVALVQLQKVDDSKIDEKSTLKYDRLVGLLAVIIACFSSGFSGVFMEKILKGTPVSLCMRNLQLAFFSVFGSIFMVFLYDWAAVAENGFFQGFNFVIWIVVLLQAYGGLLIALVVKYADNILKGFAVSVSIIISCIVSYVLLGDFEPTITFAFGAVIVVFSTFLYGYEPRSVLIHRLSSP